MSLNPELICCFTISTIISTVTRIKIIHTIHASLPAFLQKGTRILSHRKNKILEYNFKFWFSNYFSSEMFLSIWRNSFFVTKMSQIWRNNSFKLNWELIHIGSVCFMILMLQTVKKETIARSFVFFGQHIICLPSRTESLHLSLRYNGIFDFYFYNNQSCPLLIQTLDFRRKHIHDEMSCRCAKDKLLFDTRSLLCNSRILFPGCWQAHTLASYLSPRVCLWWCQSL